MRPGRCDRIPRGLTRIKTHIGGLWIPRRFGADAPTLPRRHGSFAHGRAPLSRGGSFYQGLDV